MIILFRLSVDKNGHIICLSGKIMNGRGEELCRVVSHWRDKEPLEDISKVNLIRNR